MMFEDAVQLVINLEGGYVNHPNDPGGETKFGISKRSYPHIDIKSLTKEQAIAIYKQDFWDKCKIEKLPPPLRLIVFDCAVNQGQGTAIKLLQKAIRFDEDGVLGPKTLEAVHALPVELVIREYAKKRLNRYFDTKNFDVMGEGWVNRLMDIVILASVFRN